MRSTIELPPLHSNNLDPTSEPFSHLNAVRRRELLPSILSTSPPGRSSTLPPIQRNPGPNRPRKQSVSKRAREPQHRRQKSRGDNAHLRRMSYDRKAYSAEPSSGLSAAYGKRWEDLIDAATSATEDADEDRTPVSCICVYTCYTLNINRSRHLQYQLTEHHFLHSPHPTFKDIKLRPSNKHSPHPHIFRNLPNLFLQWRAVKAEIISTSNLEAFQTHPLAFLLNVSKYIALPVKAFLFSKNHMHVRSAYVESARLAWTY